MIVTAEPYYAVSVPSDVVVAQNVFTDRTQGIQQQVNIHYTLLPRGLYANTEGSRAVMHPVTDREHTPLALFEAYNAQRIALNAGAEKYSPDITQEAQQDLTNAEDIQDGKHRDVKMEFTYARNAVQRFEDARIVTLRKPHSNRRLSRRSRPPRRRPRRTVRPHSAPRPMRSERRPKLPPRTPAHRLPRRSTRRLKPSKAFRLYAKNCWPN